MKAIYNNTTNSLIAFKGDHRPIQICKGGQLIDNISAVPVITEQDTYTSEYKANLVGLELQGNTVVVNDYTKEVTMLLINGAWSQSNVTAVKLISVPSELVDKEITYKLETPLASGYSLGLLKGDNFLFGESVEITTTPIVASGYDTFYLNGVIDDADIPNILGGKIVEAYEYAIPSNIDVKLSGVNLLDNGGVKTIQFATFESTETGFEMISNVTNNVSICYLKNIEAETGKKYYIEFDCAFFNSAPTSARPNELHIRASNNEGSSTSGTELLLFKALGTSEQTTHKRFSITMPSGYKYLKVWFYGSIINTTLVDYKAVFTNFIVSKDEAKPYEPYFAPTTVNIPYTLATGDKLTLIDKKVMLNDTDITSSEVGQNLLALAEATQNQTNIITETSEIPLSKKIITYAKWGGDSED